MGYSDYIIATPEPMFTLWLNLFPFTAGMGTAFTAYWKKGDFCWVTFIIGLLQHWLIMVGFGMLYSFWLSLIGFILFWVAYGWNLWHTYQVYKASRATYHC